MFLLILLHDQRYDKDHVVDDLWRITAIACNLQIHCLLLTIDMNSCALVFSDEQEPATLSDVIYTIVAFTIYTENRSWLQL